MSDALSPAPPSRANPLGLGLLAAAGLMVALVVGQGAGYSTPEAVTLSAALVGLLVGAFAVAQPFAAYLVLAGSSVMLVALTVVPMFAVNAFDGLLAPILLGTVFGAEAHRMRLHRAAFPVAGTEEIDAAMRLMGRAAFAFYAFAIVSLVVMAARGMVTPAIGSSLRLVRAIQGILLFPLGVLWVTDRRRFHQVQVALGAGFLVFVVVNVLGALAGSGRRAGLTWWANEPGWVIGDPNEAGLAIVLLWAILCARQAMRPRGWRLVAMGALLVMLVMTQSRSGLLSWLVFNLLALRRARPRTLLLGAGAVLAMLPLVPETYWRRLGHTLSMEQGTFDAGSALIRVYGWGVAMRVFLDHPLFGVGYLGFQNYSDRYNPVGVILITTESSYLEVATGMGLVGLVLLALMVVGSFRIAGAVRARVPEHSTSMAFARLHTPFMVAMMVSNLTGSAIFGMVGLAQLAIWHVLLVRSAYLDLESAGGPRPAEPR